MKQSAGILVYRLGKNSIEFFLVHPGGPFWKNKDTGAWSIPKGEIEENEDPLTIAKKEFSEETGQTIDGKFIKLQPVKQKGGKLIHAWAIEGDVDEKAIVSNTFMLEWPPKSGKKIEVPEVDKGDWFTEIEARAKLNPAQVNFVDEVINILNRQGS